MGTTNHVLSSPERDNSAHAVLLNQGEFAQEREEASPFHSTIATSSKGMGIPLQPPVLGGKTYKWDKYISPITPNHTKVVSSEKGRGFPLQRHITLGGKTYKWDKYLSPSSSKYLKVAPSGKGRTVPLQPHVVLGGGNLQVGHLHFTCFPLPPPIPSPIDIQQSVNFLYHL